MNFALPKYIELETSRFCNRHCSWCPNGNYNERNEQELMAWPLFCKILNDLQGLGYEGWLAFHNYNEPLANPRLLQEIAEARSRLPKSSLSLYSNGDYLDVALFEGLFQNGIRYLRITLYPASVREVFEKDSAVLRIERWLETKKLNGSLVWKIKDVRQGIAATGSRDEMNVEIIYPDLKTYNLRGGTAIGSPSLPRLNPCYMTSHSAAIDFRGRIKMCCNIFPEEAKHKPYIIGNLLERSFEELWNSQQMQNFRLKHVKADWTSSPICKFCTQELPKEQTDNFAASH